MVFQSSKELKNLISESLKMKIVRIFFALILICIFSNNGFAQKKLTLQEAITIALNHNPNAVINANNLIISEAAVKSAYGNLIPTLNAGASWGWQRVSDKGGGTQLNYFGQPQIIPPSEIDSRSFGFSVNGNVTLFDGLSNISNINQAKDNLTAARFDFEKLKQDIILQTVTYYAAIINAEKLLTFQEEDLKFNKSMLDKTKEMFNLKMITISDVYAQEVQTANSEFSYLQAKNNFEKSKIALLNYLSMDVNGNYAFELDNAGKFDTTLINESYEDLLDEALNNRQDYKSQILKLESSEYQLTIAQGGLFPQLNGNYGFSTSATQRKELFNRRIYSIGLSLSLPIFSHWNTDYSIQAAKVQIENNTENLNALERQIKTDIKNAMLDLQTSKKQLGAADTAVTSAEANWKIKQESYTLGLATFIDQQQAYRDYLQAEYNRINQEQAYLVKQYTLLNSLGRVPK
jgi:outer membrane protein